MASFASKLAQKTTMMITQTVVNGTTQRGQLGNDAAGKNIGEILNDTTVTGQWTGRKSQVDGSGSALMDCELR